MRSLPHNTAVNAPGLNVAGDKDIYMQETFVLELLAKAPTLSLDLEILCNCLSVRALMKWVNIPDEWQ
jgi:hypothetical protein